jgi:hypothetical protein
MDHPWRTTSSKSGHLWIFDPHQTSAPPPSPSSGPLLSPSFGPPPSSFYHWYSEPVWRCPSLPTEVLSWRKPICLITFESENERIYLVIILNNWNLEAVFIWADLSHVRAFIVVAWGGRGGVAQACRKRRRHLLHLHTRVIRWRRRSGAAAARASYLLAVWGRRRSASRRRSEPPIVVSDLPPHEFRILANHHWPNVETTTITTNQIHYNISHAKQLILFSK